MEDQKLLCLSRPCIVRLFLSQKENIERVTDVQDTARDFQIMMKGLMGSCVLWNPVNRLEMLWKFVACSIFLHVTRNQKLLMSLGQWYPPGTRSLISVLLPEDVWIHHNCPLYIQEGAIILKKYVSLLIFQFPFRLTA